MSRAEQEAQTAAERLTAQIEEALAAVAVQASNGSHDLDASADRLERAARDMAVALRELARQRAQQQQ